MEYFYLYLPLFKISYMQKTIVFLSAIFIVFISCKTDVKTDTNENGYTINGTLQATNTSYVYLLNEQNIKIDSSKIKNNSFIFKGIVKTPKTYKFQVKNQPKTHSFVLENGVHNILLNKEVTIISNGELNTKINQFNILKNDLNNKKLALLNNFTKGTLKTKDLRKSIEAINADQKKITIAYIIDNSNNILSSTLLSSINTYNLKDLKKIEANSKNTALKNVLDDKINQLQKIADEKLAEEKRISAAKKIYRKPATLFSGDGLKGEFVSLESIIKENKLILIDFWASWCGPCRAVTPRVKEIYNKYKSKGFTILTVSEDKNKENWKKGIEQDKMLNWHHIFGDYGRISSMYGVRTIPYMVLIDGNGGIIKEKISITELEYQLQKIL